MTYAELSTPLTVEHFTSHPAGRFYGLPGSPSAIARHQSAFGTPSPGLFLTGSDAASLGVPGAMFGGLAAASQVLGPPASCASCPSNPARPKRPPRARRRGGRRRRNAPSSSPKPRSRLDLALEFEIDRRSLRSWAICQASGRALRMARLFDRGVDGSAADLLISDRTHGDGSNWVGRGQSRPGDRDRGPFGAYRLESNDRRKVFIATGTGVAPFLAMFDAMAPAGELDKSELYFGCRTPAEDITAAFPRQTRAHNRCVSRAAPPPGGFAGRVTQAIASLDLRSDDTDFYVCGSAAMVADCRDPLARPARPGS